MQEIQEILFRLRFLASKPSVPSAMSFLAQLKDLQCIRTFETCGTIISNQSRAATNSMKGTFNNAEPHAVYLRAPLHII